MTRKSMQVWVILMISYLVTLIVIAIFLSDFRACNEPRVYKIFKDLMPLFLSLPVAWLSTVFQKRASFLTSVRSLYEKSVNAVQSAIQYTHMERPTKSEYASVLKEISATIELFRGSFRNLAAKNNPGLYPFESLKEIHKIISSLSYDQNFKSVDCKSSRDQIVSLWQDRMRPALVNELDRQTPTTFDSPFWGQS